MKKHKKLTSKCGVTIPRDVRAEVGFLPGIAIDIISDSGGVIIRKHLPTCNLCGSVDQVIVVQEFEICKECAENLLKAVNIQHE